jgi:simple sugar transport system permease protein
MIPALAVGICFCLILAFLLNIEPGDMLAAIWIGAWGGANEAAATLNKMTPLLLTGLAVSVAYQAGLLNIGCEGQLTLGALTAAVFALGAAPLPWPLAMPLTVLAGALVGALWAFPAIWLRNSRGIHEVISTLLLNYVAIYLADFLVRGPLGDGTSMARTAEIPSAGIWPNWWNLGTFGVTAAPLAALLLSCILHLWRYQTYWGYEATACGNNPVAAKAAGIAVGRRQAWNFLLSGALAGVAGALEVVATHHRFYAAFSPGYGFDGITVAFLVNNVPGWTWLSSLLLASLRSADKWLQISLGISPNTIIVLQAVLLISVACQAGFRLPLSFGLGRLLERLQRHSNHREL